MNGNGAKRILLTSVFKPFSIPDEYNAPGNHIEHSLVHRAFTRRQGMFTVDQQCVTFPLHLIAYNLDAEVTVLEYPSLEEFRQELGRGYDLVGINCVVSTLSKAQRMCAEVRQHSPQTKTVLGSGGAMAIGDLVEPFSDSTCRGEGIAFMRDLIGQQQGELRYPIVPSVHRPNRLLGLPAHSPNYVVAVGLGCRRRCEFCATSAQFDGKYLPFFQSGDELFDYMKRVEQTVVQQQGRPRSIGFMIFDENFLMNRKLVAEFRKRNREQLLSGTQFLLFVFSDAGVVSKYSVEELLEMGVDSLWIGVESPSVNKLRKLAHVDVGALIEKLSRSGIKVFASMMAGLEEHNEALIRQDMEYGYGLRAIGYQYAPVDPIPGTPYFQRLREQGMIPDRDLSYYSMSHYNMIHPELDEESVLGLINEFYDTDYERNGPMVYRFLQGRLDGYLDFRNHESPYLRARTEVYAADLLRGFPVMRLGEWFAPSSHTRELFRDLRRQVQKLFPRRVVGADWLRGNWSARDAGLYLAMSVPGLREAARAALAINVVAQDPRTSRLQMLTDPLAAVDRARHGMVPWEQPQTQRFGYPGLWRQPWLD